MLSFLTASLMHDITGFWCTTSRRADMAASCAFCLIVVGATKWDTNSHRNIKHQSRSERHPSRVLAVQLR